jgi:3-hydroxyacyl-CoA dehydrogenase
MINEGYKILEEGVALRAVDIDRVWLRGYGLPLWRGGSMCYAEQVALVRVLASIEGFSAKPGAEWWNVANLPRRAAALSMHA